MLSFDEDDAKSDTLSQKSVDISKDTGKNIFLLCLLEQVLVRWICATFWCNHVSNVKSAIFGTNEADIIYIYISIIKLEVFRNLFW